VVLATQWWLGWGTGRLVGAVDPAKKNDLDTTLGACPWTVVHIWERREPTIEELVGLHMVEELQIFLAGVS
jgi:hypothetical protein